MVSRDILCSPGTGARSLLTWATDLWPYVNGKALVNGIRLEEMNAPDMLDVIHYFFEEDSRYISAEQADAASRAREIIYSDFYNTRYPYATSGGAQGATKNFDIEPEDSDVDIIPFDPTQKKQPTKPFIAPTKVDATLAQPFGELIDGPLEH